MYAVREAVHGGMWGVKLCVGWCEKKSPELGISYSGARFGVTSHGVVMRFIGGKAIVHGVGFRDNS